MDLLSADRELTRNSYYAATAERQQAYPPLQGDAALATWRWSAVGWPACRRRWNWPSAASRSRCSRRAQLGWGASGRNGGQAIHGLACDQSTIEAQLGLDEAKRVWDMSIEALDLLRQRIAPPRHRLRLARRLPRAWPPTRARAASCRTGPSAWSRSTATRSSTSRRREMPRWIASERFHSGVLRSALGPPASAEVHAGAGARGRRGRRDDPRADAGAVAAAGRDSALAHAAGRTAARHVLLAGNVYLQGIAPQLRVAHHAGRHLYRLHRKAATMRWPTA